MKEGFFFYYDMNIKDNTNIFFSTAAHVQTKSINA